MGLVRQRGKASAKTRRRRRLRFYQTRMKELRSIAKALMSTRHPFLVHIIPMRRCNLDCTYCNEFDDTSKPVPLEEMRKRLDTLPNVMLNRLKGEIVPEMPVKTKVDPT